MKKYIGLEEMSNANCASVLNLIRQHGALSRKEISALTSLSWGGTTKIVNKLLESEYIVEDKCEKQSGQGRIPSLLRISRDKNLAIGLDVNRMGFSAYVMNLAGEILQEYAEEGAFDNKENLLRAIVSFLRKIVEEYRTANILAIGVAMQGVLDVDAGVSVRFPHCNDWENVPIREILEKEFGVAVFVEHDPDCILYGLLEDDEQENTLLFRIDSSVGMAAFVGGRILKGSGLLEIAHQIVVPGGKQCRCGHRGCLEAYIAPCFVNKEVCAEAVKEMLEPLALCMGNMCSLFNAKRIILTGDLMKHRALFEGALLEAFHRQCGREEISVLFVDASNSAVYGAALTAVDGAIRQIKIG